MSSDSTSTTVLVRKKTSNKQKTSLRCSLAIVALSCCFTGSQIGTYTIGPGLQFIAPGLGVSREDASWIPNAAGLASACAVPCIGYIQDMSGRRVVLAIGLALNIIGIILFGTAKSFAQAIAAQVFSGIGSVIQELTAIAAIAELVPMRQRGIYLALPPLFSSLFAPSVLYANLLSTYATWRWLLWINLIWNVGSAVFCAVTYFAMSIEAIRRKGPTSWKQLDFLGILLLDGGFALILVAINSGGLEHSWSSAYVLGPLITGILALLVFVGWEVSGPKAALAPKALFQGQRAVALAFVIGIISSVYYTVSLNLAPSLVQEVFDLSPTKDGLLALGPGLGLSLGASIGNAFLTIFRGKCREVATGTCLVMIIFTAAEAALNPSNSASFAVFSTMASVGIGATIVPVTTWVTFACPQDLIGTAVSLVIALRSLAGSVGYTILNNIYESQKTSKQTLDASMTGKTQLGPSQLASAGAAKVVFLATIPFGAVAVVAAIFLPDMRKYISSEGAVTPTKARNLDEAEC